MKFDIISTIVVETRRYSYTLNDNGTRNIDRDNSELETLEFKFNSESIQHIIFREGPMVLRVDDKELYFDYKRQGLIGMHFENEEYIWMMSDFKEFLANCRESYLRQKITERFLGIMDECHEGGDKEYIDEIKDEFEAGVSDNFK